MAGKESEMWKKYFVFFSVATLVLLSGAGCKKKAGEGEASGAESAKAEGGDPVWIRVNDEEIHRSAVQQEIDSLRRQIQGQYNVSPDQVPDDMIRHEAMRRVVQKAIVEQTISREGITVDQERINEEYAKFKERFPSEEVYKQQLEQNGLTEQEIKDQISKMLRYEMLVDKKVDLQEPTEEEVAMVYERSKDRLKEPAEAEVQQIMISITPTAGEDEKAEKYKLAVDLAERAGAGENFEAMVEKYSEAPYKDDGGTQTYVKGQMPESFDLVVFALEPGEVSDPIETPMGYYVVKLVDVKPERTPELKEVKEDILKYLAQEKEGRAVQTYVQGLVDQASVEYLEPLPELEQPPATPHEPAQAQEEEAPPPAPAE